MNTSTMAAPIEHHEALQFISRYERKLKRRTRQVQQRQGLGYMDAQSIACTELGFNNHYQFRELMKALRSRAKFFSIQEDRIRCATNEKPHEGSHYYWFHAFLGFDAPLTDSDCGLMPKSILPLMSKWIDWEDEARATEIRVASFADPEKVIRRYLERRSESLYIINTEIDLCFWILAWGGAALIRAETAKSDVFARHLAPFKCKAGTM